MKTKMTVIMLLMAMQATTFAYTCKTGLEAQVAGKLTQIKLEGKECLGQVQFSHFNSSIMCPLDISDADGKDILLKDCSKKIGDIVGGILILDGDSLYFER